MKLIINHPSENGNRRVKLIPAVKDIVFDYGYEFPVGVQNPAVKLILPDNDTYALLNAEDPQELTRMLKQKLRQKVTIELPLSVLDKGVSLTETLGEMPIDVENWVKNVPLRQFRNTEAAQPFYKGEWTALENGNCYPILKKNSAALADLWAATMPTPGRLSHHSKINYFHALLIIFRALHSDVRL